MTGGTSDGRRVGGPVHTPLSGVQCLARGVGLVMRRPKLWPLGLLPAVVTFAVLLSVVIVLAVYATDLVAWATPFADGWSTRVRDVARLVVAIALVALVVWVSVLAFVSLTLLFGQPFYEKLSRLVDEELGNPPAEADEVWHRGARRAVRETLATVVRTLPLALLVFVVGLVPVVGQIAGFALGALVGGRFLVLELLGPAMERRGRYLPDRLALVRAHRAHCYGLGVPLYLLFLVPVLNVLLMPGAVAGATMLVRELVDEPSSGEAA